MKQYLIIGIIKNANSYFTLILNCKSFEQAEKDFLTVFPNAKIFQITLLNE